MEFSDSVSIINQELSFQERRPNLFEASIVKIQQQVHPTLEISEEGTLYIENLVYKLLRLLCDAQPKTVDDIISRVEETFPAPIDKWSLKEAHEILNEKPKRKTTLLLPAEKLHPILVKEVFGYKIDYQVTLFLMAILEYITVDIVKLAGCYVKNIRRTTISVNIVKTALSADEVLMNMFAQDEVRALEEQEQARVTSNYYNIVKELISQEKCNLRNLDMIIKLFKKPLEDYFSLEELDDVFANVSLLQDFSTIFLGLLEDAYESYEEASVHVGHCFTEISEAGELDAYCEYTSHILSQDYNKTFNQMLNDAAFAEFRKDHSEYFLGSITEAFKYVLPKLMLTPIHNCLRYFDIIKQLIKTSSDEADRERLQTSLSTMRTVQARLEKLCQIANFQPNKKIEPYLKFQPSVKGKDSLARLEAFQNRFEAWEESHHINASCTENIMEGYLLKYTRRSLTERHVFLLDSLMISSKPNNRRNSTLHQQAEFRIKERFWMRKIHIRDVDPNSTLIGLERSHMELAFEVIGKEDTHIFVCKNQEEKSNWMAALVSLSIRSTMERLLIRISMENETQMRRPPPSLYPFSEPDSPNNILFEREDSRNCGANIIKAGTLLKLVERLTFHKLADPTYMNHFLTTYRSFCKPLELLDLLMVRFDVPDIEPLEAEKIEMERGLIEAAESVRKFRKEYTHPVQVRVLNVMRQWVMKHFYDFEQDETLHQKIKEFLQQVKSQHKYTKCVESIIKHLNREVTESPQPEFTMGSPPTVEWHIFRINSEFSDCNLLTLHPIEVARQLTLIESDLFRAVKPSELVGSAWTKADKEKAAPNLLKLIHHNTKVTQWVIKSIVETQNIDERVAVIHRVIDILCMFRNLQNFAGIFEVVSALQSAAVYRLEHSFELLSARKKQEFEELCELGDIKKKKYTEKLKNSNPPCIPFVGSYLTKITRTLEGYDNELVTKDTATPLINFFKCRKVAAITGEIQQYQLQPYNLQEVPSIKNFFENLQPTEGMSQEEFDNDMYARSLEIEPRNAKTLTKFPRKYDFNIRSPGIKANRMSTSSSMPSRGSSTSSLMMVDRSNANAFRHNIPRASPRSSVSSQDDDSSSIVQSLASSLPRQAISPSTYFEPSTPTSSDQDPFPPSNSSPPRFNKIQPPHWSKHVEARPIPPPIPPRNPRNASSMQKCQTPLNSIKLDDVPNNAENISIRRTEKPPVLPPRTYPRHSDSAARESAAPILQ